MTGNSFDKVVDRYIEAWKVIVEVQRHFNDLELRIRNFGIGAVTALVAAYVAALDVDGLDNMLGFGLALLATVTWGLVYLMDRGWYHRLLMGAVYQGRDVEAWLNKAMKSEQYESKLEGYGPFSLTEYIVHESPLSIGKWRLHSKDKMDIFYGTILLALSGFTTYSAYAAFSFPVSAIILLSLHTVVWGFLVFWQATGRPASEKQTDGHAPVFTAHLGCWVVFVALLVHVLLVVNARAEVTVGGVALFAVTTAWSWVKKGGAKMTALSALALVGFVLAWQGPALLQLLNG